MFQTENDKLYINTIFESKETLIVPKYQRGYRWGEKQVLELLNDLNEIISKNNDREKEYCLNPISLFENSEGKIVIVDGQQRLTTFLILYYYLNQTINVKLLYEARNDKENILTILKEFKQNENKENFNIDEYYFSIAFATIEKFFKTNNKEAFISYFNKKNIYYYLYEIKSSDEYNVFIRMNKEKIPLTEGELIKSLFIDYDEGERIKKENEGKINISFVWDLIEQKLHDEDFWYFIHNVEKSNKFNIEGSNDCRIGYILEIVAKINNYKDESILKFYYDEYKEFINNKKSKIKKYWYDIEHCFGVLNDWFDDIEMYHYVGFILYFSDNVKEKIVELYNIFKKDNNKEEFINELKTEIGEIILRHFTKNKKLEISNWDELIKYQFDGENLPKTKLMPILLLANIQYVINKSKNLIDNPEYNRALLDKISYYHIKVDEWQIEHITPASPADINNNIETQKNFIKEILYYFEFCDEELEEEIKRKMIEFIKNDDKDEIIKNNLYEKLRITDNEKIINFINNEWSDVAKNTLLNFCLLDHATNEGYQNALFPEKRRWIIGKSIGVKYTLTLDSNDHIVSELDKKYKNFSSYILPCTDMVFNKSFAKGIKKLDYWSLEDGKDYVQSLEEIIKKSKIKIFK